MLSDEDIAGTFDSFGWSFGEDSSMYVPVGRAIESAACAERDARIAELDRSLDVMAQNTEAQAHASLQREIELTEKVEKLTRELEEARKAMELARSWIAEKPDLRQCSAGKVVSELTLALSNRAAIKDQK